VEYAKNLLPQNQQIRFLDPAFGTGSFYSALLQLFPRSQIVTAVGYEIDSHYTVKWTTIGSTSEAINFNLQRYQLKDLFTIKRGLATGANNFFILTKEQAIAHQIPAQFLKPILPSPRYLLLDEISADALGNPILEQQLFLLDCNLPVSEIENNYPTLWKYLQMGIESGISSRYLCKHRNLWYSQENRSPTPYLCTYMGRTDSSRGKAFRFILNNSNAIALILQNASS
jgi:hypothetical protein